MKVVRLAIPDKRRQKFVNWHCSSTDVKVLISVPHFKLEKAVIFAIVADWPRLINKNKVSVAAFSGTDDVTTS